MTPKQFLGRIVLCAMTAALPPATAAQEARSSRWVNLRAGPDRGYPLVARLGPSTPLAVQGCTEGFGWCDVIAPGGARGWIYGGNIVYPYQSSQVPVIRYGAVIGVPIVTFVIGRYWNDYYRSRPWYDNRWRWENRPPLPPGIRPPPVRPRPPPTVRPAGERPGGGGGRPPGGGSGDRPGGGRPGGGDGPRPPPR